MYNSRNLTMNTLYNTMVSSLPISTSKSSIIISTHLAYSLLGTCCPPGHLAPNGGMQNPSHMQALEPENPCLQLVPCPQQPIESTQFQPSIAIQDIRDALRHPRPINTLMFALALVGLSSLLSVRACHSIKPPCLVPASQALVLRTRPPSPVSRRGDEIPTTLRSQNRHSN